MSAVVSSTPDHQDTRLLLAMSPPPSDREERERGGRIRTLLDLLTTEKLDGVDRATTPGASRWKTLKERLGLKGIGCCGSATWHYGSPPLVGGDADTNEDENDVIVVEESETRQQMTEVGPPGMNLAAALAAERQFREPPPPPGTPLRVSLTRLLEENGEKFDVKREKAGEEMGSDSMCCVCMGRKKGAALIPCGHTYCRVCTREVWLNRGSCPLCNLPILEILDIY